MPSIGLITFLAALTAPMSAGRLPLTHPLTLSLDTLLAVDHYLDLEQVGDPQVSPDGKTIVYSRSWVDKINDRWESSVWAVNADGTKNRFLVKGSSPVW